MAIKNPKELSPFLLSDEENAERTARIMKELSQAVRDPPVTEAPHSGAVALVGNCDILIDECFKLSSRLQAMCIDDFHGELPDIESPEHEPRLRLGKSPPFTRRIPV